MNPYRHENLELGIEHERLSPVESGRAALRAADVFPPVEDRGQGAISLNVSTEALRDAMVSEGRDGNRPKAFVGHTSNNIKRVSIVGDRHKRLRGRR